MLPPRVRVATDLVTSRQATTQGFIAQARAKSALARPHLEDAARLQQAFQTVSGPEDLADKADLRGLLLAAVGISVKAASHLSANDQATIIRENLRELRDEAGPRWKEQMLLRFALTRGDSLGGSSRNRAGAIAKKQFADAVQGALGAAGIDHSLELGKGGNGKILSVSWDQRVMVFDRNTKLVGKNIDVIVLQRTSDRGTRSLLEDKNAYVACGEIKGGIDPAGADEHWKTAHAALERIRSSFGLQPPALFFAAAAIENSMAQEIFAQLRNNSLTCAANLTKPDQVSDLAQWLVGQ